MVHSSWPLLRPYQTEVARAILAGVRARDGRTISVTISRQGGKNELSAQVESLLLLMGAGRVTEHADDLVKVAPSLRPQGLISLKRLWDRLGQAGLTPPARREANAIALGRARFLVLSAAPGSNVVGHTAGALLECDEAQDVDPERWSKDFAPMAASQASCQVFYGTPWTDDDLLAQVTQRNRELEVRDGMRRHFAFDWQIVAACNPAYRRFALAERERLGEQHPAWLTQYCLLTIPGTGRLLTRSQLASMRGIHPRRRYRDRDLLDAVIVAGLDVGGERLTGAGRDQDRTVLTLLRVEPEAVGSRQSAVGAAGPHVSAEQGGGLGPTAYSLLPTASPEPRLEVVEHVAWRGLSHDALLAELAGILGRAWRPQRLVIDATGLGEGLASALAARALQFGCEVLRLRLTEPLISRLGFGLQAAAGGRLRVYSEDGSPESQAFWDELAACRAIYKPNRLMGLNAPPGEHDDYVLSLALAVEASTGAAPRIARGRRREPSP